MNEITLRVEVDFMSRLLTQQAHDYDNIEEYQSLRVVNFAYDEETREFRFLCELVEETIQ